MVEKMVYAHIPVYSCAFIYGRWCPYISNCRRYVWLIFHQRILFDFISLFEIEIDPTSKPKFFIQPNCKKKHLITFLGKGQENATKQFADMKFQFSRDLYTIARQSDTRAVISKTFFVC